MSSSSELSSEKDRKRKDDTDDVAKVHSANSWEKADLGDDERRKKFLKLMGATKKEHHGRFVIGDKDQTGSHGREKEKTEELNKDLENQFIYSQEHKITRWSHTGLGFEEKTEEEKQEEAKKEEAKQENRDSNDKRGEKKDSEPAAETSDKDDRKRESTEPSKGDQSPPKKPKLMAFVKASD